MYTDANNYNPILRMNLYVRGGKKPRNNILPRRFFRSYTSYYIVLYEIYL